MLISLNWLKQYVKIDLPGEELVALIGARLVEVEQVIDNTHKYDHVYAVFVQSAEKIPNTHLSLCKIDDGNHTKDLPRDQDGLIQVLCGAPNVRAGMFAVWIAPGATVPATFHDPAPLKISVRKMLGKYDSYGMLAGADELDFGDDHSGIVALNPASTHPGDALADLFDLRDLILDIENKSLTHRPDTFGVLGFAREVAGILGQHFETPAWYSLNPASTLAPAPNPALPPIKLTIADPDLCARYTALVFNTHGEAQDKYLTMRDTLLARSGMRPIEPIVDATNYFMLLTGQPLHAFDYDKFIAAGGQKSAHVVVRAARAGEQLTLLDGKTVNLLPEDIVICSHDTPVALAGAMGGANTVIDASTKRIMLESATFSLFHLRKTQMAHGIFSEAVTRFTKGQPAGQTLAVALAFAADQYATLRQLSLIDTATPTSPITITLSLSQINGLLGTNLRAPDIVNTLSSVGIATTLRDDILRCSVPFWRTDLRIPEDIIEEIGRLRGFDNITPTLPLHSTANQNPLFALKRQLRTHLASRGAHEILSYSFVHGDLLKRVGQDPKNSYRIINSISPDLQYIRQSLLPSLLEKTYLNLRAGYDRFAIFEMNQVYTRSAGLDADGVPASTQRLAFLIVSPENTTAYYYAKRYLAGLLSCLGVDFSLQAFLSTKDRAAAYFEPQRSANIVSRDLTLGYLGEFRQAVLCAQKLPANVAAFELDLSTLQALTGTKTRHFHFSQYPSVSRDLTLAVSLKTPFAAVVAALRSALDRTALIYTIIPASIYQATGASEKHLSFHLKFAHPDHTLSPDAINKIMHNLETLKITQKG